MLLGMSLFHRNYTPRHISFGQLFLYVVRTPAPEYTLCSPISLSQIPLKAHTQHKYEAAEALLSLFSSRFESLVQPNESYNMDVVLKVSSQWLLYQNTPSYLRSITIYGTSVMSKGPTFNHSVRHKLAIPGFPVLILRVSSYKDWSRVYGEGIK
jgi:hypothetical protein